jgi:hypothetical protein
MTMMLGTLIKHAMRAQGAFADEIATQDTKLAARIETAAAGEGLTVPDYVADTLQRFLSGDNDEAWTTVVSSTQRADDPGYGFIEAVLKLRLSHQCKH